MIPNLHALLPFLQTLGRPSRRELLRWSLLSGISVALLSKIARAGAAAAPADDAPLALEPSRYRTLAAVTERILPSDSGPGAREAKVIRFIDRQLAGDLRALLPALNACAALLDQWSQRKEKVLFVEASPAGQDAMLGELSRGQIPAPKFPQAEVFKALHTLTLEGFLSDPAHGGNDQQVGWTALGVRPMSANRGEAPPDRRGHKLRILP